MYQFVMKKRSAEGTGDFHSLPCQMSPCRVTIWEAKLESHACFLSVESEHEKQIRI